ncbi:MAG TPA: hypothetical protein VF361_07990 [Candidatus Limnocylindrales bacterium]
MPEIVGSLWLMAWFGAIPLVWMAFLASVVVVLQSRGSKPAYPTWNLPMPASRPKIAGFDRRPVLYAVGMALLSLPFVAAGLSLFDGGTAGTGYPVALAMSDSRRLLCAAPPVLVSACVASSLGAIAVRRQAVAGFVITLVLALVVAIGVLAAVLALNPQQTEEGRFCLDSCAAILGPGASGPGLAIAFLAWSPLEEPLPVGILIIGVLAWTLLVRRVARQDLAKLPG